MRALLLAITAAVLLMPSSPRAQAPTPTLTPGALGLLALDPMTPAGQALVIQGLTNERPPVRAAAARVVFALGMRGLLPQVLAALTSETDDEAALEQARFVSAFGSPDDPVLVSAMTRTTSRVSRQINALRTRAQSTPASNSSPPAAQPPSAGAPTPLLRLASGYPREFVRSVLEAARCNVEQQKGAGAAARVSLRPDGRVARVTLMETPPSKECARAAQALIVTHVVAPERRVEAEEMLVFPFQPGFVACQDTSTIGTADRLASGGPIQAPTQISKVQPRYPDSAQSDRVKGTVIIEATVSPAGCVVSAHVLRGVDLRLDWAALRAVAQWLYTPAVFNGVPTQVIMTVTVTFNLN